MQVPCDEGIANHIGLESCAVAREGFGEALTGEHRPDVAICLRRVSPCRFLCVVWAAFAYSVVATCLGFLGYPESAWRWGQFRLSQCRKAG